MFVKFFLQDSSPRLISPIQHSSMHKHSPFSPLNEEEKKLVIVFLYVVTLHVMMSLLNKLISDS